MSRLGGPGTVDRKRGLNPGGPRPVFHAAEDPWRPDPELHHLTDLPFHLRKQAHGRHREGEFPSPGLEMNKNSRLLCGSLKLNILS